MLYINVIVVTWNNTILNEALAIAFILELSRKALNAKFII